MLQKTLFYILALSMAIVSIPAMYGRGADVRGTVVDGDGNFLSGIIITLCSGNDSTSVTSTITDENGCFHIYPKDGSEGVGGWKRHIMCRGIGYDTLSMDISSTGGDSCIVVMRPALTALPEVEIVHNRVRYDSKGYTVDLTGNRLAAGKSAPELLGFMPGITYNPMKGLQVLSQAPDAIYLDGVKISSFDEIRNIPATEIKSLEVKYMGGVSESATSIAPVLYVTLRKPWDGSYDGYLFGWGKWYPEEGFHSAGLSPKFSIRTGNLTVSNTFGYTRQRIMGRNSNQYEYTASGDIASYDAKTHGHANTVSDRFSVNYILANGGTLNGTINYNHICRHNATKSRDTAVPDYSDKLDNDLHANDLQAAISLQMPLANKDARLTVAADYILKNRNQNQSMTVADTQGATLPTARQENFNLLKIKGNVSLPVRNGEIYTGIDFLYNNSSDKQSATSGTENNLIKGYNPGVFVEYSGQAGRLNYGAGVRFQGYITDMTIDDTHERRTQYGLCPSANLMYFVNRAKGHRLRLNYYYTLNPFPYTLVMTTPHYQDNHSITTGNKDLCSPRTHGMTVTGDFFNILSVNAHMGYATNDIDFHTETVEGNTSFVIYKPYNIPYCLDFSIGADAAFNPLSWWTVRPAISVSNDRYKTPWGYYHGNFAWDFSVVSSMRFKHDFGVSVMFEYEGERRRSDVTLHPVNYLLASVDKYLLNRSLLLKMEAVIFQDRRIAINKAPDVTRIYKNRSHNENIEFSVCWFFNGGKREQINTRSATFQQMQQIPNSKNF